MDNGWIKLHRSIMNHWVYDDYEMEHYWIDLLLLANHKQHKKYIFKNLIVIEAGQHHTSVRQLSARWNVSKDKVRSVLKTFEQDNMIITEKIYNGTLITIVNYGIYQGRKDTDKDTDSYTDSYTHQDTDKDTDSILTRSNKNDIRMIKNDKEKRFDPGGYEIEE